MHAIATTKTSIEWGSSHHGPASSRRPKSASLPVALGAQHTRLVSVVVLCAELFVDLRVLFVQTVGTDSVGQLCLGVFVDVGLDPIPEATVVTNLLAGGADGDEAPAVS